MTDNLNNRYIFHWISIERLQRLEKSGVMKPYWTHYVFDEKRFIKGISGCKEPMLWNPDEDHHREPCLIIDISTVEAPLHSLSSSETYYLTRSIKNATKAGKPIDPILKDIEIRRTRTFGTNDEVFIEGSILKTNVVAIGYEDDDMDQTGERLALIKTAADAMGVPLLDMTGWQVSAPGYSETDDIISNLIGQTSVYSL